MALDYSKFPFCTEFCQVEKVIEVVVQIQGEAETVRIEALFNPAMNGYKINSYVWRDLEGRKLWADYELPWVMQRSADSALDHALGFLRDRCDSPSLSGGVPQ